MAVPEGLLSEANELRGPIIAVRDGVTEMLRPDYPETPDVPVVEALEGVESSVEHWARVSGNLERRLLEWGVQVPADRDDVQARIGGLMMLHLAIASDVAKLAPFDDAAPEARVSDVHQAADAIGVELPQGAAVIDLAALGPEGLIAGLSTPADEIESGLDPTDPPKSPPDVMKEDLDEIVGDVIDDVVTDMVERAARCGTAVLVGLAGGVDHAFATVLPHIGSAISAAPDDVNNVVVRTAKHVVRMIRLLVARARAALRSVLGGYREAVRAVLGIADPGSLVVETLAGRVVGRILSSKEVRKSARERLARPGKKRQRINRIRDLKKTHHRWVGPVRVVAGGLPHLWAVPVGPTPIPAAPVAAAVLLGWTVMVTGDQLDSPGPFPNIWRGVIRRADGE